MPFFFSCWIFHGDENIHLFAKILQYVIRFHRKGLNFRYRGRWLRHVLKLLSITCDTWTIHLNKMRTIFACYGMCATAIAQWIIEIYDNKSGHKRALINIINCFFENFLLLDFMLARYKIFVFQLFDSAVYREIKVFVLL